MKKVVHFKGFLPSNCRARKKFALFFSVIARFSSPVIARTSPFVIARSEATKQSIKTNPSRKAAFSLVELLMALLVASLLMAALAPVMTKKFNENIHVDGNMSPPTADAQKRIIDFGSNNAEYNFRCDEMKTDADGSEYCEGEFTVPSDYNGIMKITVIGAGGGGGTAPTAGYTEYTTVSNAHQFTVPAMVNKIETTLVSGGAGGGIDAAVKSLTFVTYGNGNVTKDAYNDYLLESTGTGKWTIPVNSRGQDMIVTACGGGGGGGSSSVYSDTGNNGYGGGSGGYIQNRIINFGNVSDFTYYIGGGGGASSYNARRGDEPKPYGGGGTAIFANASNGDGGANISTGGTYPMVSCIGGAAGIGNPNGVDTQCACATISGGKVGVMTFRGGGGGKQGGGKGGECGHCNCMCGAGGGGGGASQIVINSNIVLNAPGGGGGSSFVRTQDAFGCCPPGRMAGGGGGGGTGGGAGGSSGSNNGKGGAGGKDASGYTAVALPNNIFGSNYCNGGNGAVYSTGGADAAGAGGKSGAIKLSYIDYDLSRGKGGGSGSTILNSIINAAPHETLTISTGAGGAGGIVPYINKNGTTGTFTQKVEPGLGTETTLKKGGTVLINTGKSIANNGANKNGANFSIFNGDVSCIGGIGGTESVPNAAAPASGYGCGGGAGYMGGNGGAGSGGYARISWNKYWDTNTNKYKLADIGAGGGGASGNALTYTVSVISGQKIKIRIGKGGKGAYISNNAIVNAKKGGDTIFGDSAFGEIKAGGGYGGNSPSVNSSNNALINGTGGNISDICHYKSTSLLNKSSCKKGTKGLDANNAAGGKGATFTASSDMQSEGGEGGIQDTSDNSNGKPASGLASGGGGAAIRDLGKVDSSSQTNITNNQIKGGDGTNGRIIVEWWK